MNKCIIIEDEIDQRQVLEFYLKKIGGVQVLGAYGDTVQATINIERHKPDFIFLDINISGLEGPEFIELLEHQPKIIVVTGHSEDFLNKHYSIPYTAFVQKPIDEMKIIKALSQLK